jgi:DNA/RNA endonuclease YhcR with UshA esterase domain
LLFATMVVSIASAQQKLLPSEARAHIGESATVCGTVVSSRFAASTKGQPTFLNLDKSYPSQVFTVLIWGESRSKFGSPESEYKDKHICVTGTITVYRGVPEIVVNDPKQIKTGGAATQ